MSGVCWEDIQREIMELAEKKEDGLFSSFDMAIRLGIHQDMARYKIRMGIHKGLFEHVKNIKTINNTGRGCSIPVYRLVEPPETAEAQ